MVVVATKKFACSTCIKGHRSSSCNHLDRPLFAIRAKGRPVSQCEHCRELRKTKQVHVKCECDTKPPLSPLPDPEGQPIVARKGARKVKTLENQKPVFPNGIPNMEEAERYLAQLEASELAAGHEPGCTCKDGGSCSCCTDRYVPKHARGDSSTVGPSSRPTHGSRPSISLSIPPTVDGPSSPAHATTPTHARRGSRSHSRSPSRSNMHNGAEGHVIGGSPNDHRAHSMLYSPYPTVNGGYNQSPSSAIAASMSPSHLAPPGLDNPFAYTHDMSAPSSPLSVDYDRPGSAISNHSGRNSPFDYGNIPGTPSHLQTGSNVLFGSADMTAADAIHGMTLGGGNSSPHSATVGAGSSMDQLLSSQRLSPVTAFNSYRSTQQDVPSPISPTTPQFLSPTESSAQTSPTSYAPMQQVFNTVDAFGVPSSGQLDMRLAAANFSGSNQQYADVFDDMDPNDPAGIIFGNGDRSRRGSHQSLASSHSGHGTFLQANATSPFAPGSAPISAATSPHIGMMSEIGDLSNDLALLSQSDGTSNPTCSSSTKGCTCLNMDGSHKGRGEMCGLDNCPCCTSRNYNELAINALFGGNGTNATSGFAVSTERDTANMGAVAGSANGNSSPVASSLGMGYTQVLQIPLPTNRSRSSSQSSFSSLTNGMGGMEISIGAAGGATALGRANSTGQIGRNSSKFKSIAPKPIHHNTDPVLGRPGATQLAQSGSVGLTGSQQPFSFPRASPGGPPQPPALTLTQPQPTDGTMLEQLFQGTLDSSSNSGQSLFGNNQTFNPKPLFDFASASATASDIRHSRNFSHPTNLQTVGTSLSGPPSPHTRSPIHFGDASGTGSGPASPLLHNASSIPNSPLMTQPSSPSMHQSTPIITFSHGRSQSSSNAGLLEPRPVHYSHPSGHARSASASLLDPRSSGFPSVIVTPASPHPGSSGQQH